MNQTVIITGASRGIGRATAELFAARQDRVVINYNHSGQAARALAERLTVAGAQVIAVKADVSVRHEVADLIQKTHDRFGLIDVLVNNAGIAQQKLFTDLTDTDWDHMMSVNLKSQFLCCQAVLPDMLQRKSGRIVNLSSIWGIAGGACEVHYSAAKAAVIGMTKALAKELAPSGILVNCVAPGAIDTDMNGDLDQEGMARLLAEIPLGRLGRAEEIAHSIYFLAQDNHYLTGQVLSPNGGFAW